MRIIHVSTRFVAAAATFALGARLSGQPGPPRIVPAPPPARDGAHDFDVIHGTWFVHHTQMPRPLSGTAMEYAGVSFVSRTSVRPLAGGAATLIESDATLADSSHRREASLLTYNPATRQWTIRRIDVETGTLSPGLTGAFVTERGGVLVGDFVGQQEFESRTVLVRHHWRLAGLNWAQWDQAFSADGGRTWETNWSSQFNRVGDTLRANSPEPIRIRTSPVNGDEPAVAYCCSSLELRRYEVPNGRFATMTELFDQENTAMRAMGGTPPPGSEHYISVAENIALLRDLDRPNSYVWLRGLIQLDETELNAFYHRPLWVRHTEILTRADVVAGDAYFLSPAPSTSSFLLGKRGASPIAGDKAGLIVATVYTLPLSARNAFENFFWSSIVPRVYAARGRPLASFATSLSAGFMRGFRSVFKPKSTDEEHHFIWFARFADAAAYARFQATLARDQEWKDTVDPVLKNLTKGPPELWRLVPVWQWRPMF